MFVMMQALPCSLSQAIQLCPWAPDPVLNRGVVLEAQGEEHNLVRTLGDPTQHMLLLCVR
jgi:hypothetical protein